MFKEYDPNGLLDEAARILGAKNDVALSLALKVAPPVLSKLRHHKMGIGPSMVLKLHEIAGLPVKTIRGFIGGEA